MSDYGKLIEQSFGSANPALPQVVGNIAENPDQAVRAMELAAVTGTPASAIYGDLDEFERTNRAQMASEIVRNNPHLADFVQSNPMVPKIANDDYGNLDAVSQKVSSMGFLPISVRQWLDSDSIAKGAVRGFGESPIGGMFVEPSPEHRFLTAVAASALTIPELALRGINAAIYGVSYGALGEGLGEQAAQVATDPGLQMTLQGLGPPGAMLGGLQGLLSKVHPAALFIKNGREPPPSILPEYDAFRAERNAKDVEALGEVVKDAQTSLVRERNPDLFRDFVRQHTDAEIGIGGDAVAALYGDKPPLPDDGMLGWVPGIAEQLELARKSGDDIHIPLADWVARVDPEVMKALKDDIRVRPGAITAREAQLSSEASAATPPPIPLPEEVPAQRAASALEPLLSVGDRKLKLERLEDAQGSRFGRIDGFHDFSLNDQNGQPVGTLNLSEAKEGKQLYIEMINGLHGLGPRDFGPALMRDLLRQIKEQFPNAESITGHRVSGAREKAGSYMAASASPVIKLDNPDTWTIGTSNEWSRILEGGQWETYSPNTKAYIKPKFERSGEDRQLIDVVGQELGRIVSKKVSVQAADRIETSAGAGVGEPIAPAGMYIRSREAYPIILYALEGVDPLGTARHEAIHHLRNYGFFDSAEWGTLERASKEQGWVEQFGIDRRYPVGDAGLKLEESIADAYKEWKAGRLGEVTPEIQGLFERMKAFFDAIKERISQLLGKDATWEDIFQKVDTGEVGAREGTSPLDPRAFDEKLSVPEEPSRIFERANALGMTIEQFKRYDKLIEARHAEDVASAEKRIDAAQKRVQTSEWKANRAELRKGVAEEINLRPDIAADNYFADGVLYGEKVDRIKLGTDYLTEAQRASLPRDYYNKAGASPDDLAGLFGFPDGATLVGHLSSLSEMRRQSGMRPIDFKRRVIDIETDRQMRVKYGVLEDNIMDAVKEQVASETQLSLLHEETLYYAVKAGEEPLLDKAAVQRMVSDEFEQSSVTSVSSDRYLATAGRAGKAVENALLKQDFAGAFREKQRQFYSMVLAKEAIQFENQTAKFEKLATRLTKREVKAVEPEYLDFIHGLLAEAGAPVKRSLDEINQSKVYHGQEDLGAFVESKSAEGWDLAVSEDLANGKVKQLDTMSVSEMRDFMDAVTSLNHVGRAVRKIEIAGEKRDWAEFRQGVIDNITQLPARSRASQGRWLYQIDASLTRMEEIAKDLDLRTELGPLHQAVIEPMMRSKAKEFDLMTDLSKHFQETRGSFDGKWRKSLHDTIDQDVLHDPYTQAPYDMTRENLIQVMLNWGNRSNIGKFVQGAAVAKFGRRLSREEFPAFEAQIKGLIDKHATAEDWQFVQRMWQPFKKWQEQMQDVSRSTSGVVPKLIEIGQVETPHGAFEGGYWPVKYDRLGSNISVITDRPVREGVFGGDYFRAATSKGYLKERTGYVDFVDISTSLEQAAGTMQQTIHDIAFRDSLIQAGKVFYDKGIRAAIRKHYGSEYEAQLVPWLRRIAHQFSTDDSSIAGYNDFLRRVRINLVGHALPLNLKVILSPDVGVPNPKAWASYIANRSENTALAMEKSDEIRHLVYNMDRDFRESLDRITLDPTMGDLQKKAITWGFVPIAKVSQEFRVSTFVDQYHKALGRGKTEQEAALIADSFVRERHGAASVVDLPAVMQSNEGMKMLTMFYGYFNTMYNWQRQLPGNVRRGEAKNFAVNGLGSVVVGAAFGAALFNQQKESDSWFKTIAKAMLMQPLSTIPVLNTATSYFAEGYAPRTPVASLLGAAGSIITDAKKLARHERIDKPIQHVSNVIGLSTGLPLAQLGRSGQFGADVANNKQKPKNITEWARGIITGEAKLKQ